jgi:hypothetical protein
MSKYASKEDYAEAMGYDAGRNKPNEKNCHFSIFATPEMTRAWERGKKRGDAERESFAAGETERKA